MKVSCAIRRVLVCTALVLYAFMGCRSVLPWISYALNQAEYAAQCENKQKPEMHCHGKCKAMRESAQAVQDPPAPSVPRWEPIPVHEAQNPLVMWAVGAWIPWERVSAVAVLGPGLDVPEPPPKSV